MQPPRRSSTSSRQGAFVVSLDFELRWGLRDYLPADGGHYRRNLLGVREAIPAMLALFQRHHIQATWATVGMLLAKDLEERRAHHPDELPAYRDSRLSPYNDVVGLNEREDPLHYAGSLVDRVVGTPGQELATHTFSHYYCLEEGQTEASFAADLESAARIAKSRGVAIQSLVLPRNQMNSSYLEALRQNHIRTFRGNPRHWAFRASTSEEAKSKRRRAVRLMDAYVPAIGDHLVGWDEIPVADDLYDVRASAFLRPWSKRLARLEPLRLARIRRSIRRAATEGKVFHLWWHPHNFGTNLEENIDFLDKVLLEVSAYRASHGLQSLSMGEVADVLAA